MKKSFKRTLVVGLFIVMFAAILVLLNMLDSSKENHLQVLEREQTLSQLNQYVKSFDEKNAVVMGSEELISISISGETFDDEAFTYLIGELNKAAGIHDVQIVDGSPTVALVVTGTSITLASIDALAESNFTFVTIAIGSEIHFDDESTSALVKLWNAKGLFNLQVYGDFSEPTLDKLRELSQESSDKFREGAVQTPLPMLAISTNDGETLYIQ